MDILLLHILDAFGLSTLNAPPIQSCISPLKLHFTFKNVGITSWQHLCLGYKAPFRAVLLIVVVTNPTISLLSFPCAKSGRWEDSLVVTRLGWREVHGQLRKITNSWASSSIMVSNAGEWFPSLQVSLLIFLYTAYSLIDIPLKVGWDDGDVVDDDDHFFVYVWWCQGLLRCGKSCRLRWINYLRPDLKRGALSEVEENQIIQLHSRLGNR